MEVELSGCLILVLLGDVGVVVAALMVDWVQVGEGSCVWPRLVLEKLEGHVLMANGETLLGLEGGAKWLWNLRECAYGLGIG